MLESRHGGFPSISSVRNDVGSSAPTRLLNPRLRVVATSFCIRLSKCQRETESDRDGISKRNVDGVYVLVSRLVHHRPRQGESFVSILVEG